MTAMFLWFGQGFDISCVVCPNDGGKFGKNNKKRTKKSPDGTAPEFIPVMERPRKDLEK